MNYLWRDINYHVILQQGWGGSIGDCEINIVAKRINPPDQQQIVIKHAYEKMLLVHKLEHSLTATTFYKIKLIPVPSGVIPVDSVVIPVHSGVILVHSGAIPVHSGSFRFILVHSGVIPVHSGVIPVHSVHSGPFHLIPVHSALFRCLVTPPLLSR